ncbi:hypothetical protein HYR99_09815 [Candidatus Poribacteria bacterium]|nr:hypothetical protein [Candidatus Poribacteria bacterium]
MRTFQLDWEDDRLEHIARHDVEIDEVLEVYESRHLRIRASQGRYKLYGQTMSGRYLFIVVEKKRGSNKDWLVTARGMNDEEKRMYRRRRR